MFQPERSSSTRSVVPSDMVPLAEVVKKAQARDHAAFEELYEYYKIPLWRRLFYLVGNKESAYDLFQETFLRVWNHLPEKTPEIDFEPWLYRIAKNLAIDYFRHTIQLTFLPLPESEPDEPKERILFGLLSSVGHEESICERLSIQQALEHMSPQYRVCVLLQDVWGYSQREIAKWLAISEKAVSSNVSRGRKQLSVAYQSAANSEKVVNSNVSSRHKQSRTVSQNPANRLQTQRRGGQIQ